MEVQKLLVGGESLKFYASIRLDVRRSITSANSITEGGIKTGNMTKVKVIKNKVAPPFRECEFDILYGKGIDDIGEYVRIGKELDILKLRMGIITYEDIKYPVEEFTALINDNPEFLDKIRSEILNLVNGNTTTEPSISEGLSEE